MPTMRLVIMSAIVALLVLAICPAFADDQVPAQQTIELGLAYSDMGDFGSDWGMRALWNWENLMVMGGWNNVDDTVSSPGGPMRVNGDLWQLDVSYVLWSLNEEPEEKPNKPDIYYGLGIGLANIDAEWTLGGITSDAKEVSFAAHVVAGARWKHVFADLRYEFATDYWDYDSDGVQVSVGATWPLR